MDATTVATIITGQLSRPLILGANHEQQSLAVIAAAHNPTSSPLAD
jgi:hypothetical protein